MFDGNLCPLLIDQPSTCHPGTKTKYGGGVELKNLGKFIEIAKYGGGGEPENLGKFIEIAKYGGEGSRKTWEN